MCSLDADDYIRRVLSPAVEAFESGGRLPDYFERYELPLDVSSPTEIEEAIRTVTAYWNKTKTNSRYKELLARLLDPREQAEARKNLTTAELRLALRGAVEAERHARLAARFKSVDESIRIVAAKGFITPQERIELLARFKPQGFAESDIAARIKVPVHEDAARGLPKEEGLPKVLREQIRSSLQVLGCDDLYKFLGLEPGCTSRPEWAARVKHVYAEWRQRPNDYKLTAANNLLGIVEAQLVKGDPGRYEAARVWEIIELLRPEVRTAAPNGISPEEFRSLLDYATRLGLDPTTAAQYIQTLAHEIGAAIVVDSTKEFLRCGNCMAVVPRTEAGKLCPACGAELWTACPKCHARVLRSVSACGECGFAIADQTRVRLRLAQADIALRDGRLADARSAAGDVEQDWGHAGEAVALLDRVQARVEEADRLSTEIREALAAHQLVGARRLLATLASIASDHVFEDGRGVVEVTQGVDAQLNRVQEAVQRAREHERMRHLDEAVLGCYAALAVASDASDAAELLRRVPPEPPTAPRATVHGNSIRVEWSPSRAVGEVAYVVVRREGRAALTPGDGTEIARTTGTAATDGSVAPGTLACYSIFTDRGGAVSAPATSGAVLVAAEVAQLVIEAGDGVVTGSWKPLVRGRVQVVRKEGSPPAGLADGVEVAANSPSGFVDRTVSNGTCYFYGVFAEYTGQDGNVVRTPAVVVSTTPEQPPAPVEDLGISVESSGLLLTWTPPLRGAVAVYRLATLPPWASGSRVPATALAQLGAPLGSRRAGAASDRNPGAAAYFLPVTSVGDAAVVGRPRRWAPIADIAGLVAADFGSYLTLQWQWPDGCRAVLIAWRTDAPPASPDDPRAARRRVTRGEYDHAGAFRVDHPEPTPHNFVVFAEGEVDGETVYAPGAAGGARAAVRSAALREVRYEVTRGFLKRSRVTVRLCAAETILDFPDVVVVAKRGDLQPLRLAEGDIVATLSGLTLKADAPLEHEIDLGSARRPLYLRAFFRDASAYQRFRLIDPEPRTLKIT